MGNINVDLWETLDFDTLTTGNLGSNDNASTGTWTITGATYLSMQAAAERTLLGTINTSLNDASGSYGLRYVNSADFQAGYLKYEFASPSDHSPLSGGFWFYCTPAMVGTYGEHDLLALYTYNQSYYIKLTDENQLLLWAFNPADTYSTSISLSPDTWYWITWKYTANTAVNGFRVTVYDTSGNQVGTEKVRPTYNDTGVYEVNWGSFSGYSQSDATTLYFDDLLLDWTDATYPLGPGEGGGSHSLSLDAGSFSLTGIAANLLHAGHGWLKYRKP